MATKSPYVDAFECCCINSLFHYHICLK
uniref:Uncharacterized protein n=1 Tax=Vitis vinifera TaxID=29760 RepID=F6H3Q5_VITVI